MISPQHYRNHLMKFDRQFANEFGALAIHNCAWDATPYFPAYSEIDAVGYIDMGLQTDLQLARELFPHSRRAVMLTPADIAKDDPEIERDLLRIADQLGPCDVIVADIDLGTPEDKIRYLLNRIELINHDH